jgi:hypothetical protein
MKAGKGWGREKRGCFTEVSASARWSRVVAYVLRLHVAMNDSVRMQVSKSCHELLRYAADLDKMRVRIASDVVTPCKSRHRSGLASSRGNFLSSSRIW